MVDEEESGTKVTRKQMECFCICQRVVGGEGQFFLSALAISLFFTGSRDFHFLIRSRDFHFLMLSRDFPQLTLHPLAPSDGPPRPLAESAEHHEMVNAKGTPNDGEDEYMGGDAEYGEAGDAEGGIHHRGTQHL